MLIFEGDHPTVISRCSYRHRTLHGCEGSRESSDSPDHCRGLSGQGAPNWLPVPLNNHLTHPQAQLQREVTLVPQLSPTEGKESVSVNNPLIKIFKYVTIRMAEKVENNNPL